MSLIKSLLFFNLHFIKHGSVGGWHEFFKHERIGFSSISRFKIEI